MSDRARWRRPADVPVPSVWRRFEGKKAFANGKKPKFRIQDFTEDMMDDLTDNLSNHFVRDEELCKSLNLKEDAEAMKEMLDIWKEYTKHNLVLVCLLENKEEAEDDSLPVFAGCNMTGILEPDSPHHEVQAEVLKKIFRILDHVHCRVDCFERYGVPNYLYAMGLSVHRSFRGQGIGQEILRARFDMGRAVGLSLTVTIFTSVVSQKLAERLAFETLYELPYEEYKVDGKTVFDIASTKSVKLMAARIAPNKSEQEFGIKEKEKCSVATAPTADSPHAQLSNC